MQREVINSFKTIELNSSIVEAIQQMDAETELQMIEFETNEALKEFCRVNQYFNFNTTAVNELKNIYAQMNTAIRMTNNDTPQTELNQICHQHYQHLYEWLIKSNNFAEEMYGENKENIQAVACSEYSANLQLSILQIDLKNLKEPILDIGCGHEMNLVNYLRKKGFEAFGIDRFDNKNNFYIKNNWLEYNYEPGKWGTIISNLAFSNHFNHHNLRLDGNFSDYAQKYMEILAGLKYGGSFYYAPNLPFIETHLNRQTYSCTIFKIEKSEFKASRVTRML